MENNNEFKINNSKRERHMRVVTKCMSIFIVCVGLLSISERVALEKNVLPIYYCSELDEYYTNSGQSIYKVTVKVPAQEYPCEIVENKIYTAPVGYVKEGDKAVDAFYGETGELEKIVEDPEISIENNYMVMEKKNTGLVKDNSVTLTYSEDYINEIGAVFNENEGTIYFPDRYFCSYGFNIDGNYSIQDCEVVDIEKIETAVFDNSLLDKVVNLTDRIENVAPEQGRALEKLY